MPGQEDEILMEMEEEAGGSGAPSLPDAGGLGNRYSLDLTRPILERDTPFAKAYRVTAPGLAKPMYALLFEKHFAPRMDAIETLRQLQAPGLQKILDAGRYVLHTTRTERYAVILEDIPFPTLAAALARTGPLPEALVAGRLIPELAAVVSALAAHGVVHGGLHSGSIYYDPATHHLVVGECVSTYCGFSQPAAYETLSRALCGPEGKGTHDATCDTFALGMVVAAMLLGRDPFAAMEVERVLEARLAKGSHAFLKEAMGAIEQTLSRRMSGLLGAVMTDHDGERWNIQDVQVWVAKKNAPSRSGHAHRATAAFVFQSREFYACKHLAHALFQSWEDTRRSLVTANLASWLRGSVKSRELAERIEILMQQDREGVLMSDQRLARIIMILDPDGPIRYRGFAFMPSGIGPALAQAHATSNRESLRAGLACFTEDLMDGVSQSSAVTWSPGVMVQYLRSKALGFGHERCLYELNPTLPCQGKLSGHALIADLKELLAHLESLASAKSMQSQDPVDRHVAAFIACKLRLTNEIRIRAVHSYPRMAGNQQVVMLALLTLAQADAGLRTLKGLAEWMQKRLGTLVDTLHSEGIRKELSRKIEAAAKTGDLRRMYKVLASEPHIKRDVFGFQEARRQYHALQVKIVTLRQGRGVERMAFQKGLRLAAGMGYLVLVGTILLLLFRAV